MKIIKREQTRNRYKELPEKEKNIKREYGKNRYKNMSEENKQRLKEYQNIIVRLKNQDNSFFCLFFLHGIKWEKKH